MRQYLVATSLALMVSFGLLGALAGAKPPDLPADDKIQCPVGQEKGEHGGVTIDLDVLSGRQAPLAALDAVNPVVMEFWIEQWLDALSKLMPAADPCEQQARQAFEAGERARRAGDYARARTDYQQVHLLTPTSRLGRLAIDRIIEVEERMRDAGAASEPAMPNPEPAPMLEGYMPLGLVELTY